MRLAKDNAKKDVFWQFPFSLQINPESINPHDAEKERPHAREKGKKKHEEYEDTPEYRKSLNMKVRTKKNKGSAGI